MNDLEKKQNQVSRIPNILDQVSEINKMIELHKDNEHQSMLEQYKFMKQEFINELNSILEEFNISVKVA